MASTQSNMHLLVLSLAHSRYLTIIYWPEPHTLFSDLQFPYPQWLEGFPHNRKYPTAKCVCSTLPKRNHDHDHHTVDRMKRGQQLWHKGMSADSLSSLYYHKNVIFLLWSQISSLVKWKHPARSKQTKKALLYNSIYINVRSRQAIETESRLLDARGWGKEETRDECWWIRSFVRAGQKRVSMIARLDNVLEDAELRTWKWLNSTFYVAPILSDQKRKNKQTNKREQIDWNRGSKFETQQALPGLGHVLWTSTISDYLHNVKFKCVCGGGGSCCAHVHLHLHTWI